MGPLGPLGARFGWSLTLSVDEQNDGLVDVWSTETPIEENPYYWRSDPKVTKGSKPLSGDPKVVELFCGLGGLSQGFVQAGFELLLGADIHEPSIESFSVNHPGTATALGDLKRLSGKELERAIDGIRPDVLVAGVPCQGFSRSNRKRHDSDERNQLFREFMRLARAVRPRAVLIENVSSLRGVAGGGFETAIRNEIETTLGLRAYVVTLDAADFGVPQHRSRVFFVGVPRSRTWAEPVPTFGPGRLYPFRTVRDAINDLPRLRPGQSIDEYRDAPMGEYARLMKGVQVELLNHQAPAHPPSTIERIRATKPGEPMYPKFRQRIRLHWDRPSPTQVSGGIRAQFQFGHPSQARGLSIRERCRIQSFPDWMEVCGGLVQGRIQTGNAVPPLLAQAVAESILRSL